MLVRSPFGLLVILAGCSGAAVPGHQADGRKPTPIQFAFYNFYDDHVRVSVDGHVIFDRDVTVAPDNARLGLAAVAQFDLPACGKIVAKTGASRVAERVCLTPQTRSIVVDDGPPLTNRAKNRSWGED